MGVWSTIFIYQPYKKIPLAERLQDAQCIAQAAGVEDFEAALIGRRAYDSSCEDTELDDLSDVSFDAIRKAVQRHRAASWVCAFNDGDCPPLVDQINACMKAYPEIAGEFVLFDFGIVAGNIAINDEEGDPLFKSGLMIQLSGGSSPPDCEAYADRLLASEPVTKILNTIAGVADPSAWKSALVVS